MTWLTGWNYQKQLYISSTNSTTQSSYQMKIIVYYGTGTDSAGNIYCGGNCNTDFSDIRFTDSTGSTLLNYWIESYTSSSSATVWIQIPSIPTGSNSTYIYFYYNNPSATTSSDGTNTFIFFDNFPGSTLDTTKWISVNSPTVTVSGNTLRVQTVTNGQRFIYHDFGAGQTNFSVDFDFVKQIPSLSDAYETAMVTTVSEVGTNADVLWNRINGGTNAEQAFITGSVSPSSWPIVDGTWNKAMQTYDQTGVGIYLNGTLEYSKSTSLTTARYLELGGNTNTPSYHGDRIYRNVRTRKYSSPEPTWGAIATGSLSILSTPPGAEIYLNGIDQNITTTSPGTTISNLSPDTYNILLRLTGYADWTGTITVSSGITTSVSATLSLTQWLTNWNRRKQLYTSSTNSTTQSSYQMMTTVHYGTGTDTAGNIYCGGNVKSDFSDIRFTDSTGSTLLNYWIDPSTLITGTSCNVWIQISSIPTGSNSAYIYIYYNNPSATSSSNSTNTFIFFDDFESYVTGSNLSGQGGWISGQGIWIVQLQGGSKVAKMTDGTAGNNIYRNIGINDNYSIDVQGRMDGGPGYTGLLYRYSDNNNNIRSMVRYADSSLQIVKTVGGTGTELAWRPYSGFPTQGVWYKITTSVLNNNLNFSVSNNNISANDSSLANNTKIGFWTYLSTTGGPAYFDNISIRRYANPEPTWSPTISTEQQSVTLYISSNPIGTEIWLAFPSGTSYIDQGVHTTTTTYVPGSTAILYVTPGTYDVKLTLGGYQDYLLTSQPFTAGQTYNIQATLIPIPGSLSISSTPVGADIYINTVDRLITTSLSGTTIPNLSPGTYNIRLTLTGYQDWTGTATVTSNSTTNVLATFSGSAYMTSTPSGAEIYLAVYPNSPADQNLTAPSTITNLTTASSGATNIWNYKLTLSGYTDTSGSFTATAGSTIIVPVTFPGSLYITSIPTGASIYIDNVLQ